MQSLGHGLFGKPSPFLPSAKFAGLADGLGDARDEQVLIGRCGTTMRPYCYAYFVILLLKALCNYIPFTVYV